MLESGTNQSGLIQQSRRREAKCKIKFDNLSKYTSNVKIIINWEIQGVGALEKKRERG